MSFTHGTYAVRLRVPHKPVDEQALRRKAQRARTQTYEDFEAAAAEQEAKRIWRVMAWNLKARLVAVEEGLETFAEAFMSHLVLGNGQTVYEAALDGQLSVAGMPALRELPRGGGNQSRRRS